MRLSTFIRYRGLAPIALVAAAVFVSTNAAQASSPPPPPYNVQLDLGWAPGGGLGAIDVSWQDDSNVTVAFVVQRTRDGGPAGNQMVLPADIASSGMRAVFNDVKPGTTDCFTVKAVPSRGASSAYSGPPACMYVDDSYVPMVAPSRLQLVRTTSTTVTVDFDPGSGGHHLQVNCEDETTKTMCTPYNLPEDAWEATLTGLASGHTYAVDICQWAPYGNLTYPQCGSFIDVVPHFVLPAVAQQSSALRSCVWKPEGCP